MTIVALIAMGAGNVKAQVAVEASIDHIEMLVGEQTHVTLKAVAKESSKVEFPTFQPSQFITPGVEVLNYQPLEDKEADNGFVEKSMVYTLTSFDDTLYYIPPMTVKVDGKPFQTKSLALKVLTIEVDTTHVEQFFGPKGVQENPFLWSEWSLIFWLSVLLLIIVFGRLLSGVHWLTDIIGGIIISMALCTLFDAFLNMHNFLFY